MANHITPHKLLSEYPKSETSTQIGDLLFFGVKSQKRVLVLIEKELIPFHQLPKYLYVTIEDVFKKDKDAYKFITSNYSSDNKRQFVELYTYYTFCKTYLDIVI